MKLPIGFMPAGFQPDGFWSGESTRPARLGVAVSGGSDSLALLHLLAGWAGEHNVKVFAATVDHGLRAAAKDEARTVAQFCQTLGVTHHTLTWTGWDHSGNLQDEARKARYGLLGAWAKAHTIDTVALGHTKNDQAETVLMRLSRGSGVDGLSGMADKRQADGIDWLRPVLNVPRAELQQYLQARDIVWIDDPSNDDLTFDRVKTRQALSALEGRGLRTDGLISTAARMADARDALGFLAQMAVRSACIIDRGDVIFDRTAFSQYPQETQHRIFAHALCWVSSAKYRPRFSQLAAALAAVMRTEKRTLHGAVISPEKSGFRVTREFRSVQNTQCDVSQIWDNRWQVTGPSIKGLTVKPLGEAGLRACPEWRLQKIPRHSLLASPGIWQNQVLLAAPLAGMAKEWSVKLEKSADHFLCSLLSH